MEKRIFFMSNFARKGGAALRCGSLMVVARTVWLIRGICISWEEFEKTLKKRKLAVYKAENSHFLREMRDE